MAQQHTQKKKRILIFTGALSSGGAEKQSILLAKLLNDQGFTILVVSYFGNKKLLRLTDLLEQENINFLLLNGRVIKKYRDFIKISDAFQPDVLINYLPSNNFIGGLVGKKKKIPLILGNVRNSKLELSKYLILLFSSRFFNSKTIFNSRTGLDFFTRRGFRKKKSLFIPNSIFPIPEPIVRNTMNRTLQILMVSRFEKQKNYPLAIHVLSELIQNLQHKIQVTIIGIGSKEGQIRQMISEKGAENQVQIIKNPENIQDYYTSADIFLQTSDYEGMSNSILEAMSFSLPVVATNAGDNSYLVDHGITGYISDIGDGDNLFGFLKQLCLDESLRARMGKAAYHKVANEFSPESVIPLYTKLINGFEK